MLPKKYQRYWAVLWWVCAFPAWAWQPTGLLEGDRFSAWVTPIDGDGPSIEVAADTPRLAASTFKLVTSYAALELLGPDWRWQTAWLADKAPSGEVLVGPLYWRGNGDPYLDRNDLAEMVKTLRARGIRVIEGDLVLDKSAWNGTGSSSEREDEGPRPYQVEPDPLMVNQRLISVQFLTQSGRIQLNAEPALPEVTLENRMKLGKGLCGRSVRDHIQTKVVAGQAMTLSGTLPADCDGKILYIPVLDHDRYQAALFGQLWRAAGGEWRGQARRGVVPAQAVELASHRSRSLAETVYATNKYSNNAMARALFLTIGMANPKTGYTFLDACEAVKTWLKKHHIEAGALSIENGAGLSRLEKLSPRQLGKMLLAADRSTIGPELHASLPIAGVDGTLERRFKEGQVLGRFKTGSLSDVRALAGYLEGKDGRRHVLVAFLQSRHPESLARFDALISGLAASVQR